MQKLNVNKLIQLLNTCKNCIEEEDCYNCKIKSEENCYLSNDLNFITIITKGLEGKYNIQKENEKLKLELAELKRSIEVDYIDCIIDYKKLCFNYKKPLTPRYKSLTSLFTYTDPFVASIDEIKGKWVMLY